MKDHPSGSLIQPELIEAALRRAVKRAEREAAAAGTPLVFWEDGRVVYVQPGDPRLESQ